MTDRTEEVCGVGLKVDNSAGILSGQMTQSSFDFRGEVTGRISALVGQQSSLALSQGALEGGVSGAVPSPLTSFLKELGVERVSGSVDLLNLGLGNKTSAGIDNSLGTFLVAGEGFRYSGKVSKSDLSMTSSGVAMEEFSEWLSNGRMTINEAKIRYDGQDFVIKPTLTSQQIPGVSFTPSTSIEALFQAIGEKGTILDRIFSGNQYDKSLVSPLEAPLLSINSYSFSEQPGASVIKLDLTGGDDFFNQSVLLGYDPSKGHFFGVRSIFDTHDLNAEVALDEEIDPLMTARTNRVFYSLLGDVLYTQQLDGTPSVGGSAKFNYDKGTSTFSIKLEFDRGLKDCLPGSGSELDSPAWNGSLSFEFRR